MRNSRLSRLAVILVCGFLGWLTYIGPNLEWHPMLQSILHSTQGPVGGIAAVAVAVTAVCMMVFGDQNGGIRKLAQFVCGLLVDLARWLMGSARAPAVPMYATARASGPMSVANGVYHLELKATPVSVGFHAPQNCPTFPAVPNGRDRRLEERSVGTYSIMGDKPRWRPSDVFHDGERVYIRFPSQAMEREMPQLYVKGIGGEYRAVQYRTKGLYGVVDELFDVAKLRTCGRREYVVRIRCKV